MEDSLFFNLVDFMRSPYMTETFVGVLLCAVLIWLAVLIGLLISWCRLPRWNGLVYLGLRSKFRFLWTAHPCFGAQQLWFTFTAFSALCAVWFNFRNKGKSAGKAASPEGSEYLKRSCDPII